MTWSYTKQISSGLLRFKVHCWCNVKAFPQNVTMESMFPQISLPTAWVYCFSNREASVYPYLLSLQPHVTGTCMFHAIAANWLTLAFGCLGSVDQTALKCTKISSLQTHAIGDCATLLWNGPMGAPFGQTTVCHFYRCCYTQNVWRHVQSLADFLTIIRNQDFPIVSVLCAIPRS